MKKNESPSTINQEAATLSSRMIEKFYQIRVKSIEFSGKPAIAVYFYEMTN